MCIYIRVYILNIFNNSPRVYTIHLKPNYILPYSVYGSVRS